MNRAPRRTEHLPDTIAELAREAARPRRRNALLAPYRWRYELAALVLVPLALTSLVTAAGVWWTLAAVVGLGALGWHLPGARPALALRAWTIVVQHRLRTGFARARVCTVDGRLPAILWTAPRDGGVRVLVACPAGVGPDRIHERRALLAAACFADEVEVARHPRLSGLAVVFLRPRPKHDTDPAHGG